MGMPGCAGGFAVVVGALDVPVGPQHEGGAVVPGVMELAAEFGHEGAGVRLQFPPGAGR